MTSDELIGTLEVLREQIASLANVELVGLIEAVKRDKVEGGIAPDAEPEQQIEAMKAPQ